MAYVDLPLPKFQQQFSTEEACLQAIFEARWPRGFVCPKCGHNDGNRIPTRPRIVQCCFCRRQITANTIFHRSHVPLVMWFLCIYLFAQDKGGASALRLSKQLGMHYATVWFMLQRLRFAMARRDENPTLAGYIEMDEAFFGGRSKSKRNCKPPRHNKKQVLVLVDSEPGGHWFRSDGWGSHHVVRSFGHRIDMRKIPSEKQDKELPCISLAVSHAKRFFKGTYHHFCKIHIQCYLDEFIDGIAGTCSAISPID